MNRILLSAIVFFAGVAYACGPRARSAEPERRNTVADRPVDATLDVKVRDGIEIAFRVTNNEQRKLELRFPSGQTHEFVVSDQAGREIWRWSEGRMFTQALQNRVLDASASLTWSAAWRGALVPGRYVAIATLLSENKPLEERVEFSVP